MTAPSPSPPRPVFLQGALSRITRQKTWSQRARSLNLLTTFLTTDILWWLRKGIWQIPATLSASHTRTTIATSSNPTAPKVDIYTHEESTRYIHARLHDTTPQHLPPATPIIVYVHGGAWGTGSSLHYAQIAASIMEATKSTVLVAAYSLYPVSDIDGQAEDVAEVLRYAGRTFPGQVVVLLAHSSGAHVGSLALLRAAGERKAALAHVAVLSAGPFHLMHHYLFEAGRGVADVSPMLPAARAEAVGAGGEFDERSPTCLAEGFRGALREVAGWGLSDGSVDLEGTVAARNLYLPDVAAGSEGGVAEFPKTYLMTSSKDAVVPMYSSVRFAAALRKLGLDAELLVYDHMEHVDFVTDWFANARRRENEDVLDVDAGDRARRSEYISKLCGRNVADLTSDSERSMAPSAYSRDVLRIIRSVTKVDE